MQDSFVCSHSEESSSDESFCLQLQVQRNQVEGKKIPKPVYLITNLAYQLKPHHSKNMYLKARLDTCPDVNIMPASVYHLIFKDPEMKKITSCKMQIGTCMADMVKIVGSCTFYVVHPDSKMLIPVTFYVATNDGSVLLSCKTTLALHLIQPRSRLDYLPPWASLITSTMDHPKKTRQASLKVHSSQQEVSTQMKEVQGQATTSMSTNTVQKPGMNMLVTSKEQILSSYPDIFEGIGRFPGPPYHIQVDPNVSPKQTLCRPVSAHLKEAFKKEIAKSLV